MSPITDPRSSQVSRLSRRGFLGATAAGLSLPLAGRVLADDASGPGAFRFVHMTDTHVQPERNAEAGFVRALEVAQSLDPKPDFILTGGDLVMDVLEQDEQRSVMLFDRYKKLIADHCDIPVRQCIGNHDVFGWAERKGVTPEHPKFGKRMVVEKLELPGRYYRFDHKGWRFYVLDSIQPADDAVYQGGIDREQWEWLVGELEAKPADMPAVAVTHIPLLAVSPFIHAMENKRISPGTICGNGHHVGTLLSAHNVPLALSGHMHQVDRIDYRGTSFICDGAVSGGWWKGPHKGFEEGFGVVDLHADGTFDYRYHDYGWDVAGA